MPALTAFRRPALLLSAALLGLGGSPVTQAGGLLGMDRYSAPYDTGIWSRDNQLRLDGLVIVGTAATALWEGTDSRLGRTTWQALDSMLTTAATTEVLKNVFHRARPRDSGSPDDWFAGSRHKSFPSGETAMMAAFVTPYILEWSDEQPAAWALLALPAYMGRARMASQAHWLSDVLVGAGIGFTMGYFAHQREQPLVLTLTGNGVFAGWKTRF